MQYVKPISLDTTLANILHKYIFLLSTIVIETVKITTTLTISNYSVMEFFQLSSDWNLIYKKKKLFQNGVENVVGCVGAGGLA